jgi:flagellar biosynthesis anti-sigma factor FlgM
MKKRKTPKKSGPGIGAPGDPNLQRKDALIEQARQIIAAAPEVRPEKVEPLREAVEQGTYEIDARKLANCLVTKIILDS